MARTPAARHRARRGDVLSRTAAVILAGGLGTRMEPLTADCPKPLLPVGPWTLLEHQLAALDRASVHRVVLSTGYRHEDFAPVVEHVRARGIDLTTVVEEHPLGTGGGLRAALASLSEVDAVVVLNGDLLTGHDLGAQLDDLDRAPAEVVASVHVREVPDARPYGSVVVEGGRITRFVEKSPHPPSTTVNAGTYVVRPELLEELPPEGRVSLEREVFPRLAGLGALVPHREDAYFLDVGTPAALVTATRDLLLAPWAGAAPTPRTDHLVLPGADVAPGAVLGGGSVVHPGAVIETGAVLDATIVLDGARVGAGAHITRSVLGRRSLVPAGARVVDAALGTGEVATG